MAANKKIILSGGALPQKHLLAGLRCCEHWSGTHFEGIILGKTAITFGNPLVDQRQAVLRRLRSLLMRLRLNGRKP